MKLLVAFALISGFWMAGFSAHADDGKEARLAAAKRLVAATEDVDSQKGELLGVLGVVLENPSITAEQRKEFVAYAKEHINVQDVTDALVRARAEVYTVEEMNALSDFAESPAGKSIAAKSQQVDQASRVQIVPIAIDFMKKYEAECTDPVKCIRPTGHPAAAKAVQAPPAGAAEGK